MRYITWLMGWFFKFVDFCSLYSMFSKHEIAMLAMVNWLHNNTKMWNNNANELTLFMLPAASYSTVEFGD